MASQRSASVGDPRHPRALTRLPRWLAALALLAGLLTGLAPVTPAAALELDGDTYSDEENGWSLEFDDDLWTAEEIEGGGGLSLNTEGFEVIATFIAEPANFDDADECLASLERAFGGGREWEDFESNPSIDAPQSDADAGDVYTGVFTTTDGTELELAVYLECRKLEDAFLSVGISSFQSDFEDYVDIMEDLLAGVTEGAVQDPDDDGPSPDGPVNRDDDDDPTPEGDDPTEEPEETPEEDETPDPDLVEDHDPDSQLGARDDGELDDGAYFSEVGYGLSWDPDLYEGETPDDEGTGVLLTNAETGATVELAAFEDPAIEDCIDAEVARVLASEDFRSAAESDGVRPPSSADEAVGRILRVTEDTTQRQRKLIYVECRPLAEEGEDGDPVFLVVRAVSDDEDFRASRAQFEAILATIFVGDEPPAAPTATEEPTEEVEQEPTRRPTRTPTEEAEEDPTPRPRRTPTSEPEDGPTDLGETDLAGGVFVGEGFPFRVEWDPAIYQVEDISSEGVEGISFQSDLGSFGRIFSIATGTGLTESQCVESLVAGWTETSPDLGDFIPPPGTEIVWPEGTGFVDGIGTLTLEDGRQAALISVGGCLELAGGQGFLVMQMQTFDGIYPDNAAAFNTVLTSIEVGEGGGLLGLRSPGGRLHPISAATPADHAAAMPESPLPT